MNERLKALFPDFETEHFPSELCNVQNPREACILDSEALFLCILVDKRFPDQLRVHQLHPYTADDLEGHKACLYGWTDGPNWYDHKEQSVHLEPERVVAWKLVTGSEPQPFMEGDWNDPDEE